MSAGCGSTTPRRHENSSRRLRAPAASARLSRSTLAERHPGRPEAWFSRQGRPGRRRRRGRRRSAAPVSAPIAPPGATTICGRTGFWRSATSVPTTASCCGIIVRSVAGGFGSTFACATGGSGPFAGAAGKSSRLDRPRKGRASSWARCAHFRIGTILRDAPERRRRLEAAFSTLWALLDDPGAPRPALALWIDRSGWRCPTEARHAIGAPFPLGLLPISCRTTTLVSFQALFGVEGDGGDAAAREHLARRVRAARERLRYASEVLPGNAENGLSEGLRCSGAANPRASGLNCRGCAGGKAARPRPVAPDGRGVGRAASRGTGGRARERGSLPNWREAGPINLRKIRRLNSIFEGCPANRCQ
jgi:hypothetical protein